MTYLVKEPHESPDYPSNSAYVIERIVAIMKNSIVNGKNLILIHTNLKRGLPLENINKVAGPFVEAWAVEQFEDAVEQIGNEYQLVNVQAGTRLASYDVILQFKKTASATTYVSGNIDVKATAEDIANSGKSPNITSFARIRSEYINDPDYLFIILSLKHKVYGDRDSESGMTKGVMEVVSCSVYDLKYISNPDINYNPALGTGQIQIRDIHYVTLEQRTTQQFVQLLDSKYIKSKGQEAWIKLARKFQWIKEDADGL